MAAFRAIIARWLRGGNDDLVQYVTGSPWGRLARSHDRDAASRDDNCRRVHPAGWTWSIAESKAQLSAAAETTSSLNGFIQISVQSNTFEGTAAPKFAKRRSRNEANRHAHSLTR
jgi:hypothetical protein